MVICWIILDVYTTLYQSPVLFLEIQMCTWKPYLSKSTDTLHWKWLHYKLHVTNSKTTWVKVLEYLILTVLKYFNDTNYMLKMH